MNSTVIQYPLYNTFPALCNKYLCRRVRKRRGIRQNSSIYNSNNKSNNSDGCSKHDDDGTIESFEYIATDGRASDYEYVLVASELENDNIDDNGI